MFLLISFYDCPQTSEYLYSSDHWDQCFIITFSTLSKLRTFLLLFKNITPDEKIVHTRNGTEMYRKIVVSIIL